MQWQASTDEGWELSVEEVAGALGAPGAPLLVDVREPGEFHGPLGHVPGALLLPLGRLAREVARLREAGASADRPIVAVCRSGNRSLTAAAILRRAGFAGARSMRGGMLRWNDLGLPVDRR